MNKASWARMPSAFILTAGLLIWGASPYATAQSANGYYDATTGDLEESEGTGGIRSEEAQTERARRIMKRFKEGRGSTLNPKYKNSRFGIIEHHDSNLDGIAEHTSGELETALFESMGQEGALKVAAKKAREEADKKNCDQERSAASRRGKTSLCYNLSGVILDNGSVHAEGDFDKHRKYKLSEAAMAAVERVGKAAGQRTLQDITDAYREEYGSEMPDSDKFAAIHLLRSEAAYNSELKEKTYTREWKLLRAARLAGFDTAEDRESGTPGALFMDDINTRISQGATDEEIGKLVALNSTLSQEAMGLSGGKWVPLSSLPNDAAKTAAKTAAWEEAKRNDPDSFSGTSEETISYAQLAKAADASKLSAARADALNYVEGKGDYEDVIEKASNCMEKNKWCQPVVFEEPTGSNDPVGDVITDTREAIFMRLSEIESIPVNDIKDRLGKIKGDFNENTDPKFFQELDKMITDLEVLQESDPVNYNLDTMSIRQLTGIRKGLNDTFGEAGINPALQELARDSKGSGPGPIQATGGPQPASIGGPGPVPFQ